MARVTSDADPVVDVTYMERCLELALQAQGRTAPNPVVGAVVVGIGGQVVGEGFHQKAGESHAEVHALDDAGNRARGGTLYVNLEPCCHHGKTPPCTERVLASGIMRVVVGIKDPNPKVAGGGIAALREQGIVVDVGVLEDECAWANRGFIKRVTEGRPWVLLKMATTLDGRIADRYHQSRWISSQPAQNYVQQLRNNFDCVLIGAGTARIDDPELTVRTIMGGRNPMRALIDPELSVPPTARLFIDRQDGSHTFVFCRGGAPKDRRSQLPEHTNLVDVSDDGTPDRRLKLADVLQHLAQSGVNSVLCEGGGKLAGALLEAGLIDEVHWIVAPKILADSQSVPAVSADKTVKLADAFTLKKFRVEHLGDDVLIQGCL